MHSLTQYRHADQPQVLDRLCHPFFARPSFNAGIANDANICHSTAVSTVVGEHRMSEGDTVSFTVDGHVFTMTRHDDKSDFKDFTLILATDL